MAKKIVNIHFRKKGL